MHRIFELIFVLTASVIFGIVYPAQADSSFPGTNITFIVRSPKGIPQTDAIANVAVYPSKLGESPIVTVLRADGQGKITFQLNSPAGASLYIGPPNSQRKDNVSVNLNYIRNQDYETSSPSDKGKIALAVGYTWEIDTGSQLGTQQFSSAEYEGDTIEVPVYLEERRYLGARGYWQHLRENIFRFKNQNSRVRALNGGTFSLDALQTIPTLESLIKSTDQQERFLGIKGICNTVATLQKIKSDLNTRVSSLDDYLEMQTADVKGQRAALDLASVKILTRFCEIVDPESLEAYREQTLDALDKTVLRDIPSRCQNIQSALAVSHYAPPTPAPTASPVVVIATDQLKAAITSAALPNVLITSIASNEKSIAIEAIAPNGTTISEFIGKLEKLSGVKKVELEWAKQTRDKKQAFAIVVIPAAR